MLNHLVNPSLIYSHYILIYLHGLIIYKNLYLSGFGLKTVPKSNRPYMYEINSVH